MITLPSELLKKASTDHKSSSVKHDSLRDKDKFKKILKDQKNSKSQATKKNSEEIALHEFFSPRKEPLSDLSRQDDCQASVAISPYLSPTQKNGQFPVEGATDLSVHKVDSPYNHLHPEVEELFDRMLGEMVLLNSSGVSKTTITLSSPHLSSSPLYGMQILITEYNTAPKSFNVELLGTPAAQALIVPCIKTFLHQFEDRRYDFEIYRLEMNIKEEKSSLLKKVDSISSEEEGL